MKKNNSIEVFNTKVRIERNGTDDYICITDLAKYKGTDSPDMVIRNWLNTRRELDFLHEWELAYNPAFKERPEGAYGGLSSYLAEVFLKNSGSVGKWISYTDAKGLITKKGRYGGTYAHSTIALNFANYINAKFYIRVLEEYQTLKQSRNALLGDPVNLKRNLTAGNYSLLVASVFSQMDERLLSNPQPYKSRTPFQAEADMLNEIVFGTTAKQWRIANPDKPADKNMRDYASIIDLVVLNNLQFLDSMLIQWNCGKDERKQFLQDAYTFQYPILQRSQTIKKMQQISNRAEE